MYLVLLQENMQQYQVSLLGYCLMSNHVHLVMVPCEADSLAFTLKHTHGRYAGYWNAKHGSSGHVWQGRYYSCPLDRPHLWKALRYTELNPLRAGLTAKAEDWPWSSAGVHCGVTAGDQSLSMELWTANWNRSSWKEYLAEKETEEELRANRQSTHSGRPLGDESFVRDLEEATERSLSPQRGGRPAKATGNSEQAQLTFEI
ncbi:transposase [Terriglobus albidus]|uniref:transposase n=1 Tax=Terriglobus albidus TaxID=1592106 RepID=UPI0037D99C7A